MSLNFAITGVAGYVAPKHLAAIQACGHRLVAALDPHDSVGILDRYFPEARFFKEFERFDRHLEKLRRQGEAHRVHYLTICAPNYLHDAHVRAALRVGAHAICEKPLVLNPWNLEALAELERETGQRVYSVLQLRHHPAIRRLRDRVQTEKSSKKHDIQLTYITARGNWYLNSWKGSEPHSGGLASNIGIHFFDMLLWLFGAVETMTVYRREAARAAGSLVLEQARIQWFLSIDPADLPEAIRQDDGRTYRSIRIDGAELDFTHGFENLHTELYRDILAGGGFGIEDNRQVIQLIHDIRECPLQPQAGEQKRALQ